MRYLYKIILLLIFFLLVADYSYGQKKRYYAPVVTIERLIKTPIDTISAQDGSSKQVVLYSNGTWNYYEKGLKERLESNEFITSHWDTASLFCWKDVPLNSLPLVIDLHLIDSLEQFHYPVIGTVFSKYGMRRRHVHNGVDISPLKVGEALYATFEGKVRYAKYNPGGYGNLVIIRHPNGLESWYGHLSKFNCQPNDYVSAGQIIGWSGNTGRSRGPHLHYEFRYKDQTFDPEFLIDFANGSLKFQTFQLERKFFNIHSRASEMLEEDDYEDSPDKVIADIENQEKKPSGGDVASEVADENPAVYHIVKSGDTLGAIAIKYHTTVTKLCQLNNISKTTILRLKQRLRVR